MLDSALVPAIRPVLGVSRSVLGRSWRDRCDSAATASAAIMAQAHGLPDLLARVLAGRGVAAQEAPGFLNPRLRDLMPDPTVLRDMDRAVARLIDAVEHRECVAIFGDYDVDGACSASLLADYLHTCGLRTLIHIPDRILEGYGPNTGAIDELIRQGAQLLVTVDCGTASHEPIAHAARLGLETLVLDHHQAPEALPKARALVNPNRQDDLSGLGHLCAAGVVFLTLVALNRALRERGFWASQAPPDLMASLDLVALATVADVVPLTGLNRAFVRQGLAVMRGRGRVGLAALFDVAGLKSAPESWHLGYLLGPRINAGGRIGDAALGSKLLLTRDAAAANRLAGELDRLNRERQVIEAEAVADAIAQAEATLAAADTPVLVTASNAWHPGVVGLIATRLKERFRRPSFAFALYADGTAVGSGRSVAGADLGRAVRAAVEAGLAVKGGGHAMAAGATLAVGGLEPFTAFVAERLAAAVAAANDDHLLIDATLAAGGASAALVTALRDAGPFGSGQPEPVFALGRHRVAEAMEVGSGHVRVKLRAGDGATLGAIAFRAAEQPLGQVLLASRGADLHVAGTLSLDQWNGVERVSLKIVDAAHPGA